MAYSQQELDWIRHNLRTTRIGREIIAHDAVPSTNDLARRACAGGRPEGTVILADSQTGGRGRVGRSWYSEPGTGLYVSILLRPALEPDRVAQLTLVAAVAAAQGLKPFCPVPPTLKWPNDILIGDRKAGGILSEYIAEPAPGGAVVGMGLNVAQTGFPPPLDETATSLRLAGGGAPSRVEVLVSILNHLENDYNIFLESGLAPLIPQWTAHSTMWERPLSLKQGDTVYTGTAQRLDDGGGLVVRLDNGEERRFDSGEVTLRM